MPLADSRKPQLKTIDDYLPARRRVDVVRWPGSDKRVGLLQLSCAEDQEAFFAARDYFAKKGQAVDEAAANKFDAEHGYQLCYRMLLDPEAADPSWRIFASADEARQRLTPTLAERFIGEHLRLLVEEAQRWDTEREPWAELAELVGLGPEATHLDIVEAVKELKKAAVLE